MTPAAAGATDGATGGLSLVSPTMMALSQLLAALALCTNGAAARQCQFNRSLPHEDGRCAQYMGLEPVAVLDPQYDKMLCYWPDPKVPHSPDKWQSVEAGRAHPVNPSDWTNTSNDTGMPADVRSRLSQPPYSVCKGSEGCCFDGGFDRAEVLPATAATPSPACQKRMDEYCSALAAAASDTAAGETCAEALHGVGCNTTFLVARRNLLGADQWRCYSPSALDSSLSKYVRNVTGSHCYCTRDKQLASLCSGPPAPPSPEPPSGPPAGSVAAFTSGRDGYHTYRIPSLVKLLNGDLLLFAEGRKLSGSARGWNDIGAPAPPPPYVQQEIQKAVLIWLSVNWLY